MARKEKPVAAKRVEFLRHDGGEAWNIPTLAG